MPILARLENFLDFYDFIKAVAIVYFGISKMSGQSLRSALFLVICQKMFVLQSHKVLPWEVGFRVKFERFFGYDLLL